MATLSERLRQAMKEKGMSQANLASKSGISASSISDWLQGKYEPKQDKVYILSQALRVSPAWLMGFEDEKQSGVHTIQFDDNSKLAILFDKSKDLTEEDIESVLAIVKQIRKAKGLE